MANKIPSTQEFVDFGRKTFFSLFGKVKDFLEKNSQPERVKGHRGKNRNNFTTKLDKFAQKAFGNEIKDFHAVHHHRIELLGEEIDNRIDMETCKNVVAFIDPIDGTDLVFRGFGNWCMALSFFYPPERRIIASFVGLSTDELFYATEKGAWMEVRPKSREEQDELERKKTISVARNIGKPTRVEDATICFYGQKAKYLNAFMRKQKLRKLLEDFEKRADNGEVIDTRIYNFGGNPMITKVASGHADVVLGLAPQKVYDVVPAAHIASQSGALITDLKNQPLKLTNALWNYEDRISYIVSGNRSLHEKVIALVQ